MFQSAESELQLKYKFIEHMHCLNSVKLSIVVLSLRGLL